MSVDVPSGANLPKKLAAFVWAFRDHLRSSRAKGTSSPLNPITASKMIAAYKEKRIIELTDAEVRAMVNFLRRNGEPIASGKNGYFYAESDYELEATKKYIRDKIKGERSALEGLDLAFKKQTEVFDEKPVTEAAPVAEPIGDVVETMKKLFDAEPLRPTGTNGL